MISYHLNLLSKDRKTLIQRIQLVHALRGVFLILLGTYACISGLLYVGTMFLQSEQTNNMEVLSYNQSVVQTLRQSNGHKATSTKEVIETLTSLQAGFPLWSETLRELGAVPHEGIVLQEVQLKKEDGTYSMKGTATTRDALLAYKNSLLESSLIETVEAPVSTFTLKENILFQFTGSFDPLLLPE